MTISIIREVAGPAGRGRTRRELLRIGGLSAPGLTLADLPRLRALAGQGALTDHRANARVFIFLFGGPSHIDLWDMKPDAPAEIRGEFRPIETAVPGIRPCEHLPLPAQRMDLLCPLRSMTHRMPVHGPACSEMYTGRPYLGPPVTDQATPEDWPSIAAMVQRFSPRRAGWPPSTVIPRFTRFAGQDRPTAGQTGGRMGQAFRPFLVEGDPSRRDFQVPGLELPEDVPLDRVELDREPRPVRRRYGPHEFGQGLRLARRLIEAGISLVTVNGDDETADDKVSPFRDTHNHNFPALRDRPAPRFDRAFSAVLEDLDRRGLLETTLVVVAGELGRTPRIGQFVQNAMTEPTGRDHWPHAFTVLPAGGGVRGGQVYGATTATGDTSRTTRSPHRTCPRRSSATSASIRPGNTGIASGGSPGSSPRAGPCATSVEDRRRRRGFCYNPVESWRIVQAAGGVDPATGQPGGGRARMRGTRLADRRGAGAWGGRSAPTAPLALSLGLLVGLCGPSTASDERPGIEFFESRIRPVLVDRCQKCHSSALARPKGQLRLDTREGARRGGASGPAVVPGDPEASALYQAITAADGYSPMPPEEKLPAPVIADFRRWIEMGAPDPRTGSGASPKPLPAAEALDWWSLRPLARPDVPPAPPALAGWCRTPIDRFIAAKLAGKGLHPSAAADRRTLIRRLSFDLLGLPPAPEEIAAFLDDRSPDAYERLVDRLLDSPHYGERRARHWMDLVHFAETHGHDQDRIRPHAWPYRDYLIAAFNRDTPYARFVQEQVAADALFPDEPALVVALGMIAAGPWDESSLRDIRDDSIDRRIGHYLDRDDMVATVMSTFVSATVHCARCHDHKFDPISQEDYYGLQAVFAGVDKAERPYDTDPAIARLRHALSAELTRIRGQEPAAAAWLAAELGALPPPKLVFAAASDFAPDAGHEPPGGPRPVHILRRGDIHQPGAEAVPGTLACVAGPPARFALPPGSDESARRAALARWLTDRRNPLTWRSIVNRAWQSHFGRGLVTTPNDFGRMGALPSHPELLDWLAAGFRDSGGSLKRLHRLIVTSAVYRQESRDDPATSAIDADATLLWRQHRRRLDAESIHDAILCAAGRLDTAMGGPSVQQFTLRPGVHVTPVVDYTRYDWDSPGASRRSVYRFLFRTLPDPFYDALDSADASQLTAVRNESTTPLQALVLLNNPFVLRQCEHLAARLERLAPDADRRIVRAYELVYGRRPSTEEIDVLGTYARRHGWANLCRLLINSNEFLFVN